MVHHLGFWSRGPWFESGQDYLNPNAHQHARFAMDMSIESIAVIGAGQMGNGIAQVAALSGYNVVMIDVKSEFIQRGMDSINSSLSKLASKGKITQEDADLALSRIDTSTDMQGASDVDLVVEAIPEIPELKAEVFSKLDQICKSGAILASNT